MDNAFATTYLQNLIRTYRMYKRLGDDAIAQVQSDADLHATIDAGSNSIATIVKHVAGNLRSRFRDFLTTDGEKPDRDRDAEFEPDAAVSRDGILAWWNEGWSTVLRAIEPLGPEDLGRTITIGGEEFIVVEALNRSVTHTAYHVGQIVYVARHLAGPAWRSLSIPKGQSRQYVRQFKQGELR